MQGHIQAFLKHLQDAKGRSKNTVVAYRSDLKQFHQALQQLAQTEPRLQDLNDQMLQAYLDWLQKKDYKPSTIARKWASVQSFLQYARQRRQVAPSVGHEVHLQTEPRKRPTVLRPAEVDKLLQAPLQVKTPMGLRDHAIVNLLYHKGLRVGDIVALNVDDLELKQGLLTLSEPVAKCIPLNKARQGLQDYVEKGRPHLAREQSQQALFLNQRGQRLSRQGLWLIVKRWAAQAGLGKDISPHTLRHSLAAHMLAAGMSRKDVQRKLRLRSPNSLRVFKVAKSKAGES